MKPKQPDRSVSNMDVLKDIRGLLSTAHERERSGEAQSKEEDVLKTARFEEEVRRYKELVQRQQEELEKLKKENEELTARLNELRSTEDKPESPGAGTLRKEIAQLEAQKEELSLALSQVDELLHFKIKELTRRIARIYQEAGDGDTAVAFRRTGDEMEAVESFARFLRALLQ